MFDPLVFYKSLADDTRLKALMLIQLEGELCVCELMVALALSQPKTSRHLALLRQDNILQDRRQGQWIYYRISPKLPAWAAAVITATTDKNRHYIAANIKKLAAMGNRPERITSCC